MVTNILKPCRLVQSFSMNRKETFLKLYRLSLLFEDKETSSSIFT